MNATNTGLPAPPSIAAIEAARERMGGLILETPVLRLSGPEAMRILGSKTQAFLKLELFQHANSFKTRGALTVALNLPPGRINRGFTGVSTGNHAIAVAYVARALGTSAKFVMPATANPLRRQRFAQLGGEAVIAPTATQAHVVAEQLATREGRAFIHPYEGPYTTLGAATTALELNRQVPDLDAVVVAIGGGGLCSGLGPAIKQLQPTCKVYAVEPEGAPTMFRSFRTGRPEKQETFQTIADALAPPSTEPYSMAMCQQSVDELVLISDQEMRNAMALLYEEAKLAVEPAGAAATAGLCGPLQDRLRDKRVAVMVCGSNIDHQSFAAHLSGARRFEAAK